MSGDVDVFAAACLLAHVAAVCLLAPAAAVCLLAPAAAACLLAPAAAARLLGIWQQSPVTVVAAAVLGVGHIGIHLGHFREL